MRPIGPIAKRAPIQNLSVLDPNPATAPEDAIAGLIERVTFHNEETGFAVLRVKVQGHRELVTVIGSLASVSAGEWVTAQGRWFRDREHGLQLKAAQIHCTPPTTREGIEKYLGSGMIQGIGPIYARKLVEKFGEEVFDIIEHESVRLEDVEGIGSGRRTRIKKAWNEQKAIREIMLFLHSNGVSTSRAVRIYKTYGEEAIATVRANPYTLAKDISGIGFKTADQIARNVGIAKDSLLRARAGLAHALQEATRSGHCALPQAELLSRTRALLEIDASIIEGALARLLADAELVEETVGGETLLFLPWLKAAEENIAAKLAALLREPVGYPVVDSVKAIEWCQTRTGKELAPSQREALQTALVSRVLIITGGPGVGKTTLINSLLLILRAKKVRCLLCAPTGRAAKRLTESTGLEARTIHRLLEASARGFNRNAACPLECDLLVVDEMSMVDVPLMSRLVDALPATAHLVLVGDIDQLPPVGPGLVLADLIKSGAIPTVRLSEVFRQAATSRIILNAHRVNQGQMPEPGEPGQDSDFYFIERGEPEAIQAAILKLLTERIPAKLGCDPIADIQVLCPMNRGSLGVREMNALLQRALNPLRQDEYPVEKFGWEFRLRDKVLQTQNNYDKEVFNGDIGRIASLDHEQRQVHISFEGREVAYEFAELDELAPAYAISIHKAQGSEFPAVIIPVSTQHYLLLQRNLIYTALTRGRSLAVLVGEKKALEIALKNQNTKRRYSALLQRLCGPAALCGG